ncbi:MAG: hypothetical protein PHP75_05580 [Methylacidiphilaceae bacterium]|nr:hypothetical protein [Candidatus Methylacidiphilaceae bacterium]
MATSDDIPVLVRLLEILFSEEEEFTPNGALQEQGLREILSDPRIGEILLAVEDGGPIGMVSLLYTVSTALGARVAILEDMVVEYDGHGGSWRQPKSSLCEPSRAKRRVSESDLR